MNIGGQQFTYKAKEAILNAQNLAKSKKQQQIDALHLLNALLHQESSIVLTVLEKIGVEMEILRTRTKLTIDKLSSIVTPQQKNNTSYQFYFTQDMAHVLDGSKNEMAKMADEFISVDHLFLSLLSV